MAVDTILGISYGYTNGESGWGAAMNANLKLLAATGQLSVIDRDLTAPPGTPANGDAYIVGPLATGAWAGHDDKIALYIDNNVETGWFIITPREGWLCYLQDEQKITAYKTATGWSAGLAI